MYITVVLLDSILWTKLSLSIYGGSSTVLRFLRTVVRNDEDAVDYNYGLFSSF